MVVDSKKVQKTKGEVKVVEEKKKSIPRIIFDIVFWVCIVILATVWLTDFIRMNKSKEPMFCLAQKTHKFNDGTVDECIGLGYKIYDYHRDSLDNAHQFSPLFVGMKRYNK